MDGRRLEDKYKQMMQAVGSGDMDYLQKQLQRLERTQPELLHQATHQTKQLATDEFRKGNYHKAIEYYDQVLAGTDEKQKIWSNISACYAGLKQWTKAFEAGLEAVKADAQWPKGYFRVGRALYEMGHKADASRVFQAGLKKDPDNEELQKWQAKSQHEHTHEKNIQRVTVDYKRFESIIDPDSVAPQGPVEPVIELTPEAARQGIDPAQLEAMLGGKKIDPGHMPIHAFNPSVVFDGSASALYPLSNLKDKTRKRKPTEKDQAALAICSYLQVASDLRVPRRQLGLLSSDLPRAWGGELQQMARSLADRSAPRLPWLFVGTGCGVPVLVAARELKALGVGRDARKEGEGPPIVACTASPARYLDSALPGLLQANGLEREVMVVRKRPEDVSCSASPPSLHPADEPQPSSSSSSSASGVSVLQKALCELEEPAEALVIDADMMDEGLLGRKLISAVRHARQNLTVKHPTVLPARAVVYASLARLDGPTVRVQEDADPKEPERGCPVVELDYSAVRDLLWGPNGEAVDMDCTRGGLGQHIKIVSKPTEVFSFDFDAPLEQLDEALPLTARTAELDIAVTTPGPVHAILLSFSLHTAQSTLLAHSFPKQAADVVAADMGQTSLGKAGWRQCVQWLDEVQVDKVGHVVRVSAKQTATNIRFKVVSPVESPVCVRSSTIPRWQLDIMSDQPVLQAFRDALKRVLSSRLAAKHHSDWRSTAPSLHVLAPSAGPSILPLIASQVGSRWLEPKAKVQSAAPRLKIIAADPMPSLTHLGRRVAKANEPTLLEYARLPKSTGEEPQDNGGEERVTQADENEPDVGEEDLDDEKDRGFFSDSDDTDTDDEEKQLRRRRRREKRRKRDSLRRKELKPPSLGERLTFLPKDIRQLRPPMSILMRNYEARKKQFDELVEKGEIQLDQEKAEAGAPQGPQPPPPPADPLDELPGVIDMLVGLPSDVGLLGDGLLPLWHQAWTSLLGGDAVTMPCRARVYCVGGEMGPREYEGLDVSAWGTYRYVQGEHSAVDLSDGGDHAAFKPLSEPRLLFDFDLSRVGLLQEPQRAVRDMKLKIQEDGTLNAVAFWFNIDLDEHTGITTAPDAHWCRTPPGTQEMRAGGDGREYVRSRSIRQACQFVEEIRVRSGERVAVKAAHDTTKVAFMVDRDKTPDYDERRTSVALGDMALAKAQATHGETAQKLMELMYSNPQVNQMAHDVAMSLAVDASAVEDFAIDPQEANWFFLTFFI
ncbi:unnamed protein product [Vitrella brassicaformis CCMP3155]|uniref:Uncharacterized protein n=3 Tax=Vitrella brassicaformis TaxID=1169539 RepID=A0A0G4EIK4_VITBC|nr:unnamed protein product [Vitrella brassicaformis CCMP3155]|eukprot:CEL95835.1 unnamed protein product [Vitrella brassicaformis CCMP3155]